jgi:hypothetical protein
MACVSRDIIRTPGLWTVFWPQFPTEQLGPGSSSLPALIEGNSLHFVTVSPVTVALISRVLCNVKKRMTFEAIFFGSIVY